MTRLTVRAVSASSIAWQIIGRPATRRASLPGSPLLPARPITTASTLSLLLLLLLRSRLIAHFLVLVGNSISPVLLNLLPERLKRRRGDRACCIVCCPIKFIDQHRSIAQNRHAL